MRRGVVGHTISLNVAPVLCTESNTNKYKTLPSEGKKASHDLITVTISSFGLFELEYTVF